MDNKKLNSLSLLTASLFVYADAYLNVLSVMENNLFFQCIPHEKGWAATLKINDTFEQTIVNKRKEKAVIGLIDLLKWTITNAKNNTLKKVGFVC